MLSINASSVDVVTLQYNLASASVTGSTTGALLENW